MHFRVTFNSIRNGDDDRTQNIKSVEFFEGITTLLFIRGVTLALIGL